MSRLKRIFRLIALCGLWVAADATGAIINHQIADVSASSFTVVFASSTAIAAPGIQVYEDALGAQQLTPSIEVISNSQHHLNGLAAIRVHTLASDTTYYFEFTEDTGGAPYFPGGSLLSAATSAMTPLSPGDDLVGNDLIKLDIYKPDQITSLQAAIVLLSLPAISPHPVSSFVSGNEYAYVDANNLLQADGAVHLLQEGSNIEVNVYRGLLCAGAIDHLQAFYRKHGADTLDGAQVNASGLCPAEDTVCDDEVNVLDVQFVLNSLNSTPAACNFTAEIDVVRDDEINVIDVQQILNFF